MINKKRNTRRSITLSKSQWEFLDKIAKKIGRSTSKIISWLCMKNIKAIQNWTTEEELKALIEIARTKWIQDPWEDD